MKKMYIILSIIIAAYVVTGITALLRGPLVMEVRLKSIYPYKLSPIVWITEYVPNGKTSDAAMKLGYSDQGKYRVNILTGNWEKVTEVGYNHVQGLPYVPFVLKHYQNSANPKFSFDYPEFKGWKVEAGEKVITYSPNGAPISENRPIRLGINIEFVNLPNMDNMKFLKNPYGILYSSFTKEQSNGFIQPYLLFMVSGKYVGITVPKEISYPQFSGQIIWDTIINSFALEQ